MHQIRLTFKGDQTPVELDELIEMVTALTEKRVGFVISSYRQVDEAEYRHEAVRAVSQLGATMDREEKD